MDSINETPCAIDPPPVASYVAPWVMSAIGSPIDPESASALADLFAAFGIRLVRIRGGKRPPQALIERGLDAKAWGKGTTVHYTRRGHTLARAPKSPRFGTAFAGVAASFTGWVFVDVDLRFDGALEGGPYDDMPKGWLKQLAANSIAVRTGSGGHHCWVRWPAGTAWPSNCLLYSGREGKIEFKATGIGVLPPGFVDFEGTTHRYDLLLLKSEWCDRTSIHAPEELIGWVQRAGLAASPTAATPDTGAAESPATAARPVQAQAEAATISPPSTSVFGTCSTSTRHDSPSAPVVERRRSDADRDRIIQGIIERHQLGETSSAASKDSERDFLIARVFAQRGGTQHEFDGTIRDLPRRKPEKATNQDYLDRTWRAACTSLRTEPRQRPTLAEGVPAKLRAEAADPRLHVIRPDALRVLEWLVEEAIRQDSLSVTPGVRKIAGVFQRPLSWVDTQLDELVWEGLITSDRRLEAEDLANALSVSPLLVPLTYEEARDRAIASLRKSKRPSRKNTDRLSGRRRPVSNARQTNRAEADVIHPD